MTGILDQIRNTTVADLEGVRSDFDDLPASTYRPRVEREMIRVVEGADDLHDAMPRPAMPNLNAGMVRTDGSGTMDIRPFKGQPTDKQRGLINILMEQLERLDHDTWQQGMDYILRMDEAAAWNPARDENVSRWINRLRAKLASLRDGGVVPQQHVEVPVRKSGAWSEWRELASKLAAVGGKHGTRFAVDTEEGAVNTIAFWWISPGKNDHEGKFFLRQIIGGQGAIRVRMSPEAMVAIAKKIITAGPIEAMTRYGLELGECGHCGRDLTNDESRAAGIGPVCRKHMGGWH